MAYTAHVYNVKTYWDNAHTDLGLWLNENLSDYDKIIIDSDLCHWKSKEDSYKYLCTINKASQIEMWVTNTVEYKNLNNVYNCPECYFITSKVLPFKALFRSGNFTIYKLDI